MMGAEFVRDPWSKPAVRDASVDDLLTAVASPGHSDQLVPVTLPSPHCCPSPGAAASASFSFTRKASSAPWVAGPVRRAPMASDIELTDEVLDRLEERAKGVLARKKRGMVDVAPLLLLALVDAARGPSGGG